MRVRGGMCRKCKNVYMANDHHPLVITNGKSTCEIWPEYGGSIGRWAIGEQEMFRRARPSATRQPLPLGMSSFPLVPYSNRISGGRFNWMNTQYQLNANFPPEPHAIHGTGWTASWTVTDHQSSTITLRYTHAPNAAWPFPFEAEQHISIRENGLIISLNAHNKSDQAVPLGFGHHPYFDSEGANLLFSADAIWQNGKDSLPAHNEKPDGQFDFTGGGAISGRTIDNCYAGWDGDAEIWWDNRPLKLSINADMDALVVYIPNGEDSFCVEPVPHINNAINMPEHAPQMPVIAPGQSYQNTLSFMALHK
jgi:aldose 1-epimerase